MCIKRIQHHGVYQHGVTTLDLERTRLDHIEESPWQTDTSIGPWGYRAGAVYRPVRELVHELVDIVSKNGNVLLNVPPKADGTLDDATVRILGQIGVWTGINGEALYGTRPWITFRQGESVRFTRSKDWKHLYAVCLQWPGDRLVLASVEAEEGAEVKLLGTDEALDWKQSAGGLEIDVPARYQDEKDRPSRYAWVFRIEARKPAGR